VTKSRSALPVKDVQEPQAPARGAVQAWVRFWFTPVDPVGLHAVRLLAGILFIAWLLPFAGQLDALFGLDGWFDLQAYGAAGRPDVAPAQPVSWNWSLLYLCGSNPMLLATAFWGSMVVLALFALGIWARLTSVLAWVIVVSFTANPATAYDGDALLIILAFYLMVGYVLLGQWNTRQSLAARLLGSRDMVLFGRGPEADSLPAQTSVGANLALRLLQVHLAIVLVTCGLAKLQFGDWWSGAAFWYPLHPAFQTTLEQVHAEAPHAETYLAMLSVAAYATLAWQIGFPTFAWRRRCRPILLGGALLGWLGTAFIYELPLFGPAIFIGCLAFLSAAEWHRVLSWLAHVPGLARWLPAGDEEFLDVAKNKPHGSVLVTARQR
jgi:hypothetical protein